MKVYYAHSLHLYGSPQEKRDIELLQSLGFEVVNPSDKPHCDKCSELREQISEYDIASEAIMLYFMDVVDSCDAVAYRAHVDGKIPGGVGMEIKHAWEGNKPVIELPTFLESRFLDRKQTREYLKYLGER